MTVDKNQTPQKKTHPETSQSLPEENWVWAPTGVINNHYPELWSFVFFVDQETDLSMLQFPENEYRKWELRKLYYAQHISRELTSRTFLITCTGEEEGTSLCQYSDGNIVLVLS